MSKKTILVTGSTGSTGTPTIRFLLEKGFAVRACVRRLDERSQELKKLGAEIVEGDLLDFNAVRKIVTGVERAYFCYPIRPGQIDATVYFAQAASDAKLEAIVNMSQVAAREEAKSNSSQNHWVTERVFDRFDTPVTHLRPTFFAEWFLYFSYMVKAGVVRFPFGTGRHAPITAKDQGRVISAILADPEPHKGKIYPLYGSEEMTFEQMTTAIGEALGKEVRYSRTEFDAFVEDAKAHGRGMFTPFFVQHIREVANDHQQGVFSGMNDLVLKIGGAPPTSIQDFAREHRDAFA